MTATPSTGLAAPLRRHRLSVRNHTPRQLTDDGLGAKTLIDISARFGIATSGVRTLFIAAPPSGAFV